jgi:hypothetical protein
MKSRRLTATAAANARSIAFRRTRLMWLVLVIFGAGPVYSVIRPNEAAAQGLWTESSTLGYTALGVGVAVAAISGSDCGWCELGAAVGLLAGGLGFGIGHIIGSSAEAAAHSGEKPSARQLWGVRIGTILAGASLGAVVGGVYVNRKFTKNPGQDERNVVILSVLGAAVGTWVEYGQEAWLRSTSGSLAPVVRRTPDGRTEFGVGLGTPW